MISEETASQMDTAIKIEKRLCAALGRPWSSDLGCNVWHLAHDAANEIERLRAVLTKIAAYDDGLASDRLGSTGSYGAFDEPGAVEAARKALEQ